MKKLVSVVLCITLIICFLAVSAFAADNGFAFDENGKFKILVISDMHFHCERPVKNDDTVTFLRNAAATCSPDLIVLNGDNIVDAYSVEEKEAFVRRLNAEFNEIGVRFALVFGNHDDEDGGMSKEDMLNVFRESEYCVAVKGDCEHGVCNYNIPIMKSDRSGIGYNLWFMDSHKGEIFEDQLSWYEDTAAELAAANGGAPVPAVLFQHIPVPEIYELLTPAGSLTYGAVKDDDGNRWVLDKSNTTVEGRLNEKPCVLGRDNGEFDAWARVGDVKLAVFGHDHVNTFSGDVATANGGSITLMYAGGAGFATYNDGLGHSCSLITVDENTGEWTREHVLYRNICPLPKSFTFFNYFGDEFWYSVVTFNFKYVAETLKNAIMSLLRPVK